jgi:hypothetical protein
MSQSSTGIYRALLSGLALATLLSTTVSAQPADLEGDWIMRAKDGSEYRMEFVPEGNAWHATARSKVLIDLKLNPAGLKNQWVGDLEYWGKHEVKASLKGENEITLSDLNDDDTWSLKRLQSK